MEAADDAVCEACLDALVARTRAAPLDDRPPPQFWSCWTLFYPDEDPASGRTFGEC